MCSTTLRSVCVHSSILKISQYIFTQYIFSIHLVHRWRQRQHICLFSIKALFFLYLIVFPSLVLNFSISIPPLIVILSWVITDESVHSFYFYVNSILLLKFGPSENVIFCYALLFLLMSCLCSSQFGGRKSI